MLTPLLSPLKCHVLFEWLLSTSWKNSPFCFPSSQKLGQDPSLEKQISFSLHHFLFRDLHFRWNSLRGQFHHHLYEQQIYARRSQKRQKTVKSSSSFLLLGLACIKAVHKYIDEIDPSSLRCKNIDTNLSSFFLHLIFLEVVKDSNSITRANNWQSERISIC